jgi:hypothetical protein
VCVGCKRVHEKHRPGVASAQAAVAEVEVVVAVSRQLAGGGGAVVTSELAVVRAASAES